MNKKGLKNSTFITYLLITFVIICEIVRLKYIFIEPNNVLETSISNIVYPITFLFIILLYNKIGFKETHKTIIKTTCAFLILILILTALNNIPANYYTKNIDSALRKLYTPNTLHIGKKLFYYPNLLNVITTSLLFYFSHTIILILYEAMEPYTKKFIAFSLSMFIPLTLDTICYTTINDTFGNIDFEQMILHLTSNFVVVIFSTILVSLFYSIKKVSSKS